MGLQIPGGLSHAGRMIDFMGAYFETVSEQLAVIYAEQGAAMRRAADWTAEALMKERLIYAFGSGHSHTLSEEIFYRAGGLARVVPILDENLMVHKSAVESTAWERKEGYAAQVMARYALAAGDILFVISNSGRNAVPIEMAMEAKKRGAKVVAISCVRNGADYSSRHSSGKKLSDVADLAIDNGGVAGDAVIEIPGVAQKVGPTSTITSAFILNSILIEATARVTALDGTAEVWGSANSDTTNNDVLLKKYRGKIPHL